MNPMMFDSSLAAALSPDGGQGEALDDCMVNPLFADNPLFAQTPMRLSRVSTAAREEALVDEQFSDQGCENTFKYLEVEYACVGV